MNSDLSNPPVAGEPEHELTDHSGIVHVRPDLVHAKVEIDFDPNKLSETDVRELVQAHSAQVSSVLEKSIYRLEGSACEACALKLERRVEKIPGVRRATASYMGKILTVTFDKAVANEAGVLEDLKVRGANVKPLTQSKNDTRSPMQKALAGELNEEISCGLGLVFLVIALLVHKSNGFNALTNGLYLAAYIFAGQEGVRSAIASLKEKVLDVDVLMVLAAMGAAIIGQPFEGALLLFLFSFSNVLQRHALQRTQKAIESLLTLRPSEALTKRAMATSKLQWRI